MPPLAHIKGNIRGCLVVVKTKQDPIVPGTGLILEWSGEGRGEERPLFTHILPDRRLDVATLQRRHQSFW